MAIFFTFSPKANHLRPLKVENCDSNSRLVVDEDDNGKFRLERVNELIKSLLLGMKQMFKHQELQMFGLKFNKYQ